MTGNLGSRRTGRGWFIFWHKWKVSCLALGKLEGEVDWKVRGELSALWRRHWRSWHKRKGISQTYIVKKITTSHDEIIYNINNFINNLMNEVFTMIRNNYLPIDIYRKSRWYEENICLLFDILLFIYLFITNMILTNVKTNWSKTLRKLSIFGSSLWYYL